MLDGDHDSLHPAGLAVSVLDGDLRLAVRENAVYQMALAALVQLPADSVRVFQRQRDLLPALVAGVAVHRALIASTHAAVPAVVTVAALQGAVHASGDVRALLSDVELDDIALGVEADVRQYPAHHSRNVYLLFRGDLASDNDDLANCHDLAGHTGALVLAEVCIQNSVRDLVTQLVGMSFADSLGGFISNVHFSILSVR